MSEEVDLVGAVLLTFYANGPSLAHVPPNLLRSIIATVLPAPVNRAARGGPACPVPIMITSKCFIAVVNVPPQCGSCHLWLPLRASCRPDAQQCRRHTSPTSGASER